MIWNDGDRVRVVSSHPNHWPSAPFGTVRPLPEFVREFFRGEIDPTACSRLVRHRHGVGAEMWVEFDQAADGGSGDGPYCGGMILASDLVRQ